MARKKKYTGPVFNAVHDITEKDLARQKYYELLADQEAWNLTHKTKINLFAKLITKLTR